jgi:hypothetical protein
MVSQITGRYNFRGEKMIGFANCLFVLLWNRTNIYNYLLFHDIDFSHVVFIRNWSGHIYDLRKIPLLAAFFMGVYQLDY